MLHVIGCVSCTDNHRKENKHFHENIKAFGFAKNEIFTTHKYKTHQPFVYRILYKEIKKNKIK